MTSHAPEPWTVQDDMQSNLVAKATPEPSHAAAEWVKENKPAGYEALWTWTEVVALMEFYARQCILELFTIPGPREIEGKEMSRCVIVLRKTRKDVRCSYAAADKSGRCKRHGGISRKAGHLEGEI